MEPLFNIYAPVIPKKDEQNTTEIETGYDKLYNNLVNIINNRKQNISPKSYYLKPEEKVSEVKEDVSNQQKEYIPEWAQPKYQSRYNKFKTELDDSLSKRQSYNTDNWKKFFTDLAFAESSLISDSINPIGAKGYFQIMPSFRKEEWNNPSEQFDDMFTLLNSNVDYFRRNLTEDDYKKMSELGIDQYGLLAGAHLGGAKNALKTLRGESNKKDANGTSIMSYFKRFTQTK